MVNDDMDADDPLFGAPLLASAAPGAIREAAAARPRASASRRL